MTSVNKVILIGRAGKDPEFRTGAASVCNFPIATSESWKDKQTGEKVEKTEWHNLVFFNRLAEIARDYVKKGSLIYVEGTLKTEKYVKNGVDTYSTKIVCKELRLLDKREDRYQDEYQDAAPPARQPVKHPSSLDDLDDDIPF